MGAGRPGLGGGGKNRDDRPALCAERAVGGGGEQAGRPRRGPSAGLARSVGRHQPPSETRRGRGGGSAARRGARGLRGPPGEAAGRHGGPRRERLGGGGGGGEEHIRASERASRRAAATLTLIRCRVTKWRIGPAMAAACLRRQGVRGIGGSGGEAAGAGKCRRWPRGSGARCFSAGVLPPARIRAFGPPR